MIGSDLSEEAERASAIGFTSACAAGIPDEIQTIPTTILLIHLRFKILPPHFLHFLCLSLGKPSHLLLYKESIK